MTTVGFVGLGRMGAAMAEHLVAAGHRVVGYDVDAGALEAAGERGIEPAENVGALAAATEVVLVSVPGPAEVEAVVNELLEGLDDAELDGDGPTAVIDHTTSRPSTTDAIEALLADRGVALLGAPVSGGRTGAENATLSVMVGGDEAVLGAHREVLEPFAHDVFHVSDRPAHAHAMKLLNNYLSTTALLATSEAMVVGRQIGLDVETMARVFSASTGRNSATEDKMPNQVATGDFDAGFALGLVEKDIDLFADFADDADVDALLGNVVRNLVGYARRDRGGDADMTEVYRFVEAMAGPAAGPGSGSSQGSSQGSGAGAGSKPDRSDAD